MFILSLPESFTGCFRFFKDIVQFPARGLKGLPFRAELFCFLICGFQRCALSRVTYRFQVCFGLICDFFLDGG